MVFLGWNLWRLVSLTSSLAECQRLLYHIPGVEELVADYQTDYSWTDLVGYKKEKKNQISSEIAQSSTVLRNKRTKLI